MLITKNTSLYYEVPMQVIFIRATAYEKGIVYHETVIAARDGKIFSTKEVMQMARKCGVDEDYAIVESFEWIPMEIK